MMVNVRNGMEVSSTCAITNSVKQWCILATMIFSMFLSAMLETAFRDMGDGVYIKSCQNADLFTVANFRAKTKTTNILERTVFFADDSTLIAHSAKENERIVDAFSNESSKFDLKINIKKIEVMFQPNSMKEDINVEETTPNSVQEFTYLGSMIARDSHIEEELQKIMSKASISFGCLREILWNNHNVSIRVKGEIYRTIILSTLLYGVER